MYNNKSDVGKNRLYVSFKGRMAEDEIKKGAANVIDEARKLKPGFGVISEISEFVPTTEDGRMVMQGCMKSLKEMGMGHVVRVVKGSIAGNQWQRTSKTVGYTADEVSTMHEAEALLNKMEGK